MSTLLELNDTQKQLMELLMNSDGSEDDELNNEAIEALLGQVKEEMKEKVDSYIYLIRQLEAESEGLNQKADSLDVNIVQKLRTKSKTIQNNADRVKQRLEMVVRDNNNELKGEMFKAKIQRGAYSCNIVDDQLIPKEFKKWSFDLVFSRELIEKIDDCLADYLENNLTAVGFIFQLIEKLNLKANVTKKELINELKAQHKRFEKALKEGKEFEEPIIEGAELRQAEFMRIY